MTDVTFQTPEEVAVQIKRLVEQLQMAGRKDLLLRAIGAPLLEELRIEAARAKYAIPDYVRCVEWKMPMSNFFLGRARVIVDNWQKPDWLRLGREQVYLFSPHHDRSLKSGGFLKKDRLYNRLVEAHASVVTVGSDFNKRFLRMAAHQTLLLSTPSHLHSLSKYNYVHQVYRYIQMGLIQQLLYMH